MGGKRSDHFDVDPKTPGASDSRDGQVDEKIMTEEKHEFTLSEKRKDEGMIPKRGINPALADLQAKRAERQEAERAESASDTDES